MATLVRYQDNGRTYIFIGAGFAASMIQNDLGLFGMLGGDRDEKGPRYPMAVVSDSSGQLHWVRTDQLTVVSVDGTTPADLLRAAEVRPQDLPVIDPNNP